MNGKDLAKEVSEFITSNFPGDDEVDLEDAAAQIEDFVQNLEGDDDDADTK
jgi:hypothetical protein